MSCCVLKEIRSSYFWDSSRTKSSSHDERAKTLQVSKEHLDVISCLYIRLKHQAAFLNVVLQDGNSVFLAMFQTEGACPDGSARWLTHLFSFCFLLGVRHDRRVLTTWLCVSHLWAAGLQESGSEWAGLLSQTQRRRYSDITVKSLCKYRRISNIINATFFCWTASGVKSCPWTQHTRWVDCF